MLINDEVFARCYLIGAGHLLVSPTLAWLNRLADGDCQSCDFALVGITVEGDGLDGAGFGNSYLCRVAVGQQSGSALAGIAAIGGVDERGALFLRDSDLIIGIHLNGRAGNGLVVVGELGSLNLNNCCGMLFITKRINL